MATIERTVSLRCGVGTENQPRTVFFKRVAAMFNSKQKRELQNAKRELALAQELQRKTAEDREIIHGAFQSLTEESQALQEKSLRQDHEIKALTLQVEKLLQGRRQLEKKISDLESDLEDQYAINNKLAGIRDNFKEKLNAFMEQLDA